MIKKNNNGNLSIFWGNLIISNNTILVKNSNNLFMCIKNLKNNSRIEIIEYQFENIKEMAYGLSKKFIQHIYYT